MCYNVASTLFILLGILLCVQIVTSHQLYYHTPTEIDANESRLPTAFASDIGKKCHEDSLHYIKSLMARQPWALTMYESTGMLNIEKIDPVLKNVHHDVGYFDDCLSVKEQDHNIYGQYCTVFFRAETVERQETDLPSKQTPRVNEPRVALPDEKLSNFLLPSTSFCLPSSCSAKDLGTAIAQIIADYKVLSGNLSIVTVTGENFCFSHEKETEIDTASAIVIVAFLSLFLVVVVSTIIDANSKNLPIKLNWSVWKHFSLIRNKKILFATHFEDKKDNFSCLHGLRVLSTFSIVLLHHGENVITHWAFNKRMMFGKYAYDMDAHVTNIVGALAVDNFFFMSALLVTYSQLNRLESNKGHFGILRFYAKRWLRLTPMYAGTVAFVGTVYSHLGNGPQWEFIRLASRRVRETWWTFLLYINNYYPKPEQYVRSATFPIMETWYLASEMQLYLLSPLLIYPLWRWNLIGLILGLSALTGVAIANVMLFVVNEELPAFVMISRPSFYTIENKYFGLFYTQTWARSPPYILGILIGWFLHKNRGKRWAMSKATVAVGWTVATILSGLILFGLYPYLNEEETPVINRYMRIAYGSMHHTAWSVVVAWVFLACFYGYGGLINDVLTWDVFVPLGRLCYAIYLIHYNFIRIQSCQSRLPLNFGTMNHFTSYFGIVSAVTLLASGAHLFLELPFLNLEKQYFSI